VRRLAAQKLMVNFIEKQSFQDHRLLQPQTIHLRDWLRPRVGRTDWHRIARTLDYTPRLGEVTAPTLVLCGRQDPQYALLCSQELADNIPDARLQVFERSGHYPFIEEADLFWSAIGDFLG
jgi:pimeloyl-ACP methyl ester carboxylesterase